MKLITFLASLVLAVNVYANAPEIKAVEAQVERLTQAMISANEKELRALSSVQLSYGHSSGKVENQDEFIEQMVSGRSDFVSINLKNQTVSVSNNVALVRHEFLADTADGGVAKSIRIGIFLVWQKEQDTWKLLGRQAFKLPE